MGETWFPPCERAEGERRGGADVIGSANGVAISITGLGSFVPEPVVNFWGRAS